MVKQEFPIDRLKENQGEDDSKEQDDQQLREAQKRLKGFVKDAMFKKWNVELKDRTNNKEAVMEYLGRYINRTAISNSRIHGYNEDTGEVTFEWKDYRDGGKKKEMVLSDEEFVRRFMMHIPPSGFRKLRFYGFWGYRNRIVRFKEIDEQFNHIAMSQGKPTKAIERKKLTLVDCMRRLAEKKGKHFKNFHLCPKCGAEFTYERAPSLCRRKRE